MQRADLLGAMQRGLRAGASRAAARLGSADFADAEAARAASEELLRLTDLLAGRLHAEELVLAPELARFAPELGLALRAERVRLGGLAHELAGLAGRVERADEAERVALGARLEARAWSLLARLLGHLEVVEVTARRVLVAHLGWERAAELEQRFFLALPGPARRAWLELVLAAASPAQRDREGRVLETLARPEPPRAPDAGATGSAATRSGAHGDAR